MQQQTIWTTATTVDEALTALGIDLAGAELSTSRSSSIGRQGLAIIIATEKTVIIIDAGKKRTITTTGQTLADALAAAKITVDHDDKLSASPNARLRRRLEVHLHPRRRQVQDQEGQGGLRHRPQEDEQAEQG